MFEWVGLLIMPDPHSKVAKSALISTGNRAFMNFLRSNQSIVVLKSTLGVLESNTITYSSVDFSDILNWKQSLSWFGLLLSNLYDVKLSCGFFTFVSRE